MASSEGEVWYHVACFRAVKEMTHNINGVLVAAARAIYFRAQAVGVLITVMQAKLCLRHYSIRGGKMRLK